MKRLQLNGHPVQPCPIETENDSLIRAIREFVGPDGTVSFEHGFRPKFNAQMITDKEVILRFAIGKDKKKKLLLENMDIDMLKTIIIDLFMYQNHCQLRA